jgi:hypothetical protein
MPDKGREPHIDQQLRQSIGGQSFPVPEGSWDRIANSLDRRSRRKAWLWGGAAALALLFLGTGLWYSLYNLGNSGQTSATAANKTEQLPAAPGALQGTPHEAIQDGKKNPRESVKQAQPGAGASIAGNGVNPNPSRPEPFVSPVTAGDTEKHPEPAPESGIAFTAPEGLSMQGSRLQAQTAASPDQAALIAVQTLSPRRAMQQQPALRLGFGSTPSFTLDVLQTAAQQAGFMHQDYLGIRRSQETPVAALSAGVDLSLRLRKGLVLQSGLWLQEYAVSQRYNYSIVNIPSYRGGVTDIYGNKLIEAYFTSSNPEQINYQGRSRYRSLRIPLQAGWSRSVGKGFDLIGLAGVSSAILLEESGKQINYSNLALSDQALLRMRKLQWSSLLQIGVEKSLTRNIWLGSSFRWEAALHNRYIQGSPLRSTPQQTGLLFNLQYRIY